MKYLNQDKLFSRQYRDEVNGDAGSSTGSEQSNDVLDPTKLQEQLNSLQQEKEALNNKVNELLGESKRAKDARRQAEQLAAEESRKKAEAEGNYQQLYDSSEKERQKVAEEYKQLKSAVEQKNVDTCAMDLVLERNPLNNVAAKHFASIFAKNLKFVDNAVRVIDENGNLTVTSPKEYLDKMLASGEYDFYLQGNQSTGGGANGGRGSASVKQIARAEFESMKPDVRMAFIKSGGNIID
ncbi:MAG: hypothetical protein RQ783_08545 [Gammaproteobacteria bacterium]|nr:hypothetical protein [Gammaproteobacteria bacterium]